ncbi:MAG: hypothetical protein H6Q72_2597 [Firmicutes bacterium]|nr:hypothetical protein [Bacillota bacterium]
MLQSSEVASGLEQLAESLCAKCLAGDSCGEFPICGDVQLLKQAVAILNKEK